MSIKSWPSRERPREKLINQGAQALSDAELLAIFLRHGYRGRSALDLAHELLSSFGGLRPLLLASYKECCDVPGLGPAKYATLQAAVEITRRHLRENLVRLGSLSSPEQASEFLHAELRDCRQEIFACLFLDNRHRIIAFERLFVGSIDQAVVHPRELVRRILDHNAAAVIFAHNHPSGIAEPSQADRALTDKLRSTLGALEIRVLDHLVVGDQGTTSLAALGWL